MGREFAHTEEGKGVGKGEGGGEREGKGGKGKVKDVLPQSSGRPEIFVRIDEISVRIKGFPPGSEFIR